MRQRRDSTSESVEQTVRDIRRVTCSAEALFLPLDRAISVLGLLEDMVTEYLPVSIAPALPRRNHAAFHGS